MFYFVFTLILCRLSAGFLFANHFKLERQHLKMQPNCFVSVEERVNFVLQVEELKNVPSSSEKNISDATSKKELLEKAKDKEEEKLKQVMSSLQEETREIQKEKEVC